jgi:hypothetical protein
MPLKIFVSYRRQDTAASAVGIGQYLEKEFGKKNVYIDVETHAGAKYASVIEKRLAECRVLLVLIGPDWLKLQKPNDWVQREVTYALKRDITVIPVLIDGAQLPDQESLPDDIKGLVDHQAASVSLAGFRHEMAGLVRDIRSIRTPKPWRLLGVIAAALILSLAAGIFVHTFGFSNLLEHTRLSAPSPELVTNELDTNGVWKSPPGEWVMFAIDKAPAAWYVNPSSIKLSGDHVTFAMRFALVSNESNSSTQSTLQGAYEDNVDFLDCKKSVFTLAERTVYNSDGKIIYHFKFHESLDSSNSQPVNSGAIIELSESIVCDENLRTLLLSKVRFDENLSYLANTQNGDGTVLYGPTKPTSNPTYPIEALVVIKKNNDHTFADVFPGQNVRGLPPSYRVIASNVQISCAEKKLRIPVNPYYDKDDHLVSLIRVQASAQIMDAPDGTMFGFLRNATCGPSAVGVAGNYEGMNIISYGKKGQAEQKVSVTIQQNATDLKISFQTANGASGEGTGKLTGSRADSISLHSTTPGCPGSYDGSLSFADNSTSWSYKGEDCGGSMEGHGTADKVTK